MAYTRTDTPHDALYALADRVPLAVVTTAREGALAIDAHHRRGGDVPALRGRRRSTRPGPATCSGPHRRRHAAGWPLADRLAFATLCSALAVQQFGGSLAAPGWGDIADWWQRRCATTASVARTTPR